LTFVARVGKYPRTGEIDVLNDPSNPKTFSRYMAMSQAGLEMVVPIGVGIVVDHFANTRPWGAVVGAVLGFGIGLTHLIYLSQQRDDDKPSKPRRPTTPTAGTP
jgi:F0F1-type ATP synthase assembly protein I